LKGIDCPLAGGPMIMNPADEGDTTRQPALDLIFSAAVPAKSNRLVGSLTKSTTKREMKWKDCSAG